MKPYSASHLIGTAILAAAGYFLLTSVNISLPQELSYVVGIVLGALIVPLISLLNRQGHTSNNNTRNETTTLYVGNLPYRANENAVREHFAKQGHVESVRLMKDRRTGKRKGYGFVEMSSGDAEKAIKQLNDSEFHERTLKVRLAKEKSHEANS